MDDDKVMRGYANQLAVTMKREGWVVVRTFCSVCGKRMSIVATAASIDGGYCESVKDGKPFCTVCGKLT